MFITLVAVIVALVLGHFAPALLASLRGHHWYLRWLTWWDAQLAGSDFWRGHYGITVAVLPLVLLVALLQWSLSGHLFGLPSLLFGVGMLVLCWGPRDLDRDVEAILDADDASTRDQAVERLQTIDRPAHLEPKPSLVAAATFAAKRRWFAPVFWFFLLGPAGVVLYRLVALADCRAFGAVLPAENRDGAGRWAALMEWPVVQLMTLSMALVGNFDTVFRAWREAGGDQWTLSSNGAVEAAAIASVNAELREDALDYRDAGMAGDQLPMPELRDAMSLIWRMLLLWMVLLALLILAGWIS